MKTDIEIAQEAELINIKEVVKSLDISEDELMDRISNNKDGKLILVTAINPTPGQGAGNWLEQMIL